MRSRYYDTDSRVFTTPDTYAGDISDPLSINAYTFAENNPVNYSDPSGHGLWSKIKSVAKNAWNGIKKVAKKVGNTVKNLGKNVIKKAGEIKKVVRSSGGVISYVNDKYLSKIPGYNYITKAGKAVVENVRRMCTTTKRIAKQAFTKAVDWVKEHKKTIIKVAATIAVVGGAIAIGVATGGIGLVGAIGSTVLGGALGGAKAAITGQSVLNGALGGAIQGALLSINPSSTIAAGISNASGNIASDIFDNIDKPGSHTIVETGITSFAMGVSTVAVGSITSNITEPVTINYGTNEFSLTASSLKNITNILYTFPTDLLTKAFAIGKNS